jgi:hypothetical protein
VKSAAFGLAAVLALAISNANANPTLLRPAITAIDSALASQISVIQKAGLAPISLATRLAGGASGTISAEVAKAINPLVKKLQLRAEKAGANILPVYYSAALLDLALDRDIKSVNSSESSVKLDADVVTQFLFALSVGDASGLKSDQYNLLMQKLSKGLKNTGGSVDGTVRDLVSEYLLEVGKNQTADQFIEQVVAACPLQS